MSLNTFALQPVRVDPRIIDVSPRPYAVETGLKHNTYRSFPPSGSSTNYSSGVNWALSLTPEAGLSRRAYITATFNLSFQFNNTGDAPVAAFVDNAYAPRAYPLNRSISSQTAKVDNINFSQNNSQIIDLVTHCLDDDVHKINCLNSVYRRDNTPSYCTSLT